MNAADAPTPLDAKSLWLRRWWGRGIQAISAATAAHFAVILVPLLVGGEAAFEEGLRKLGERPSFWGEALFAVSITPFIETGLMAWIIHLLSRLIHVRLAVVIVSAGLWAALHRVVTDPVGWLAFFPFFAFSYVYVERRRQPHRDGFVVATLSHALFNLSGVTYLISHGFVG